VSVYFVGSAVTILVHTTTVSRPNHRLVLDFIFVTLSPKREAKYCDERLFVCPVAYLRNRSPNLATYSAHVTYSSGSVSLWRRADKLRYLKYFRFHESRRVCPQTDRQQKRHKYGVYQSDSPQAATERGWSLTSTHLKRAFPSSFQCPLAANSSATDSIT